MRNLASAIVAGRLQAVIALLGFALLAVLLPFIPIGIVASGATAVLLGLYHQPAQGGIPVAIASALLLSLGGMALNLGWFTFLFAGLIWLLPFGLGRMLATTRSLSFSLQLIGAAGLLLYLSIRLLYPDIDLFWHEMLKRYVEVLSEHTELDTRTLQTLKAQVPYGFTAQLIASLMLLQAVMLFIGYWWYCGIHPQTSFRQAFLGLRLGRFLGAIALFFALATLLLGFLDTDIRLIKELALVSMSLFLLQGLAIVHIIVEHMLKSRVWLVASYAALILIPFFSFVLTLTGALDNFIQFRKYIKNS